MPPIDRILSQYSNPIRSWPGEEDLDAEARANYEAANPPKLQTEGGAIDKGDLLPIVRYPEAKTPPSEWQSSSDVMRQLDDGWRIEPFSRLSAPFKSMAQAWREQPLLGPMVRPSQMNPEAFNQMSGDAMTVAGTGMTGGIGRAAVAPRAPSGTFDLGMFGGRRGAEELARKGEPRPLQALNMLEQMERAGASREEIWAATGKILKDSPYAGAFRGVDQQPRFEIDDSAATLRDGPASRAMLDGMNAERRRLLDGVKESVQAEKVQPDLFPKDVKAVRSGMRNEAAALKEKANENYGLTWHPRLGRRAEYVFDHEPFLDAYPDIARGVIVRQDVSGLPGTRGSYNGEAKSLDIFDGAGDRFSTGLHELQHAVQDREGFGRGYNPDAAAQDIAQSRLREQELREKTERWKNGHTDAARLHMARAASGDPDSLALVSEARARWEGQFGSKSDENPFGVTPQEAVAFQLMDEDDVLSRALKEYNDVLKVSRLDPMELYKRHAGEVEARATQERKNLTPEQRRARAPWLDYDVPEKDQIVRFGNESGAMAMSDLVDRAKKHFGVTRDPSEAGYILPDGTMLDLSGRHYAGDYVRQGDQNVLAPGKGGGRDWLAGQRSVDHRELDELIDAGGSEGMRRFMNEARAVRYHPGTGFDVSFVPTDKALATAISGFRRLNPSEPLYVDYSDPVTGQVIASKEFPRPSIAAVKKWLKEAGAPESPSPTLMASIDPLTAAGGGREAAVEALRGAAKADPAAKIIDAIPASEIDALVKEGVIKRKQIEGLSVGQVLSRMEGKKPLLGGTSEAAIGFDAKTTKDLEGLRAYWRDYTWPSEEVAKAHLARRIEQGNKQYAGLFPATDPGIIEHVKFVKRGNGVGISRAGMESQKKGAIEIADTASGEAPAVSWRAQDLNDDGTPSSIMQNFGRSKGRVIQGYISAEDLPKPKGAGIKDGLPGGSGYSWEDFDRGKGAPPPAKIRINKNGSISILDGNHRIAYWNSRGYDSIPVYAIDERAVEAPSGGKKSGFRFGGFVAR